MEKINREEIYTGGGITFYIVKLEDKYLFYENGDNSLLELDQMYDFDWDYNEELEHIIKEYEVGSKEYQDIIGKYFNDVYTYD